MSNSVDFHEVWKRHRNGVRDLKSKYEGRVKALEGYKGSERYDREMAQAQKNFTEGLAQLRMDSQARFDRIFRKLEKHVEPESMTPPTAEQLQLLQMLDLRDRLEIKEIEQAAATLKGNDAAMKTLGDIAMRKGKTLPPTAKSKSQQRRYILDELKSSVADLMAWDGRTRSGVLSDYMNARNEWKYGNGERPADNGLNGMFTADVEAGIGAADTLKSLLPNADMGEVSAFMNER